MGIKNTYGVGTAVGTDVRGKCDGGAEPEDDTEGIEGSVDNRDTEPLDEGRGQEVEEGEQPPDTNEERVVDD